MKKFRLLQLITGVHYIHHVYYSFGFKLPFIEIAYFSKFGFKKTNNVKLKDRNGKDIKKPYHNCTLSGVY
jgi:hypothetical protein